MKYFLAQFLPYEEFMKDPVVGAFKVKDEEDAKYPGWIKKEIYFEECISLSKKVYDSNDEFGHVRFADYAYHLLLVSTITEEEFELMKRINPNNE